MVGVAYRGRIPLEDIEVDFEVGPAETPAGFEVKKTVRLKGKLSETELLRLRRANEFCPVGQMFTKGSLDLEDEVVGAVPGSGDAPPAAGIPRGTVQARHLRATQEYDAAGVLTREGEVKLYLRCENGGRMARWIVMAGHSSEGWVPAPVPLAQAALAASTAHTLGRALPGASFRVEIEPRFSADREQSQAAAAAGEIRVRRSLRRVIVEHAPAHGPIEAALHADPVYRALQDRAVLLSDEVRVG